MKFSGKHGYSGKQMFNTSFANGGRIAGSGVLYDDYGDESGLPNYESHYDSHVRFTSDWMTKEEKDALNGEVITYKEK